MRAKTQAIVALPNCASLPPIVSVTRSTRESVVPGGEIRSSWAISPGFSWFVRVMSTVSAPLQAQNPHVPGELRRPAISAG